MLPDPYPAENNPQFYRRSHRCLRRRLFLELNVYNYVKVQNVIIYFIFSRSSSISVKDYSWQAVMELLILEKLYFAQW